jgi:hypothetical protein
MSRPTTIRVPENRLFHDAWNSSAVGLRGALPQLQRVLPRGWSLTSGPHHSALVVRAPDGGLAQLTVIARSRFEPRDVASAMATLMSDRRRRPLLVAAPFLSERTRLLLADAGANYADATGNIRLALARPSVFIERPGARRDPNPRRVSLRSLRGSAARQVVEALCVSAVPCGVRHLATRAGLAPASVSRVFALLEREALVTRDERGRVVQIDRGALRSRSEPGWRSQTP